MCAASSDHGAMKTKSHAIVKLRRNREGLWAAFGTAKTIGHLHDDAVHLH